jgi:hypothetical protein
VAMVVDGKIDKDLSVYPPRLIKELKLEINRLRSLK